MCKPPSAGFAGTGFGAAVVVFLPARATAGIQKPLVTAAPPAPAAPLSRAPRDIARSQKVRVSDPRCLLPLQHVPTRPQLPQTCGLPR